MLLGFSDSDDYYDQFREHLECLKYFMMIEQGNMIMHSLLAFFGTHVVEFLKENLDLYTEDEYIENIAYGLAMGNRSNWADHSGYRNNPVQEHVDMRLYITEPMKKCFEEHPEFLKTLVKEFAESLIILKKESKSNPFETEDNWDVNEWAE